MGAAGLVEQREVCDCLKPGLLCINSSEGSVALGFEQVREDSAQLGYSRLGRWDAIAPVRMSRSRKIPQWLDLAARDFSKVGLFFPQKGDGFIEGGALRAMHERLDRGQ